VPASSSPTPAVAVAVVSWNTRELLRANLVALRPEWEAGRAEVWVVDNGSSDGSPELVAGEFPWVRLLLPGENLGFGRAVNRVAAETQSPWLAPANADVQLRPGALAALLEAGRRDPGAGLLGPRLRLLDGTVQPSVQPYPTVVNALLLHSRAHRASARIGRRLALPTHWNAGVGARVAWVTGAFVLVRRSAWDAVAGFDERQWMYAEDIDLCWRLARAGWGVRYVPEAEALHAHGAAAAQAFGADVDRRWVLATYEWVGRRQGARAARALALLNLLEARARSKAFGLLARRAPARFAAPAELARAQEATHAEALVASHVD